MGQHKFLHTTITRAVVAQELQVVIDPLADGCALLRRLQIVVPSGEQLYAVLDPEEDDAMSSKNFNYPPLAAGQYVEFWMAPHQRLALCAHSGYLALALVIEYHERSA